VALSIQTDAFGRFERLAFVSRRTARAGLGGDHRSRHPSPSTDFVDYRPYHPGDDFRRIDWNVYGRLGSLQLKLTEGRERLDVVLLLDCSGSMAYGTRDKLQFAASLIAALGYVGIARADVVRIVCLTSTAQEPRGFGPFGRRTRMPELVRELSKVASTGVLDLNGVLGDCLPRGAERPFVVIVSDLLSPSGIAAGLEALQAQHTDLVVLHIVSQEELDPAFAGEVDLVDAETEEVLELGISLETLRAYRERFNEWLTTREAECTSRGIRYARVRTDRPLTEVMLDDLRRARVLR
jgi:uncharacterized protein (DUF58 family)